jgi:hypothetical protein
MGYLALESEGAECHFRNLKIKELLSSNPKPEETANKDQGFKNLYTGLDLSGWQVDESTKKHWQPRDWVLHYDGKGHGLRTKKKFGYNEFIVDFQFPKKDAKPCVFVLRTGKKAKEISLGLTAEGKFSLNGEEWYQTKQLKPVGQWNRFRASRTRGSLLLYLNSEEDFLVSKLPSAAEKGAFELRPEGEMNFGNLFVREVKE